MKMKKYTKEFKLGAVRMVEDEGMTPTRVSKDLGVSSAALWRWLGEYRKNQGGAFPGKGKLAPEDAKLKALEKENRRLRMERDLLKKTIVFFAEQDKKNSML
jgi:transposase